jgi:gamma-glutamyltranspeptidase/glutathione hydrolase
VSAGHYLAAGIGARTLSEGGNAADAACAMGFALQVLEPHMNGPAGEVPILIYVAAEDRVYTVSGQGPAPGAATIERFTRLGVDLIPGDGLLPATVPAAFDAWCLLLERFGTRTLEEVLSPARDLAERGFPMYPFLRNVLRFLEPRFREEWPSSAAIYLPVRDVGEAQRNATLAGTLDGLIRAERSAGGGREAGIRAARDAFYRGRVAESIERFVKNAVRDASGRAHEGLLAAHDLASYEGSVEDPVSAAYRGSTVFKCPPWSQGPVFLQQLRLLEGFDLAAMDPADALHTFPSRSFSTMRTPTSVGSSSMPGGRRRSSGPDGGNSPAGGRSWRPARRSRRSPRRWPLRGGAVTRPTSMPPTATATW